MRYLLDVNALLAHLLVVHVHHARARAWVRTLADTDAVLLTPWTEIGFLRVGLQTRLLTDLATGRKLLHGLSAGAAAVKFAPDRSRATDLPGWANGPARLGDGHLAALAQTHGAQLATFDQGIPGAFPIP